MGDLGGKNLFYELFILIRSHTGFNDDGLVRFEQP
jgi:hypothetical protein